jgi:hypothetical protein
VAGGLSHPVHPRPSPCGRWLVDQVDHMWWRGVQLVWARCSPQFCTQFCWMPVGRWVCHVRRAGSWQLGGPPCWWESASQPARLHGLLTHAGHHTVQHHNVLFANIIHDRQLYTARVLPSYVAVVEWVTQVCVRVGCGSRKTVGVQALLQVTCLVGMCTGQCYHSVYL